VVRRAGEREGRGREREGERERERLRERERERERRVRVRVQRLTPATKCNTRNTRLQQRLQQAATRACNNLRVNNLGVHRLTA
jgi:hypothetical protein